MASAAEARRALIGLTRLAQDELAGVWRQLLAAGLTAEQARDALLDLLPALGGEYEAAAATLAADWYDEAREAAEVAGRFAAEPATAATAARWQALARWGVDPLFRASPDAAAALVLLSGGLQRTVSDAHRLTIVDNSMRDPQAAGWKRVGVGGSCNFCRMLIDRGHVYTDASVTFRSHDHCNCAASPEWGGNVVKVSREPFRQSQRTRSDEARARDNARAREFIAANY